MKRRTRSVYERSLYSVFRQLLLRGGSPRIIDNGRCVANGARSRAAAAGKVQQDLSTPFPPPPRSLIPLFFTELYGGVDPFSPNLMIQSIYKVRCLYTAPFLPAVEGRVNRRVYFLCGLVSG